MLCVCVCTHVCVYIRMYIVRVGVWVYTMCCEGFRKKEYEKILHTLTHSFNRFPRSWPVIYNRSRPVHTPSRSRVLSIIFFSGFCFRLLLKSVHSLSLPVAPYVLVAFACGDGSYSVTLYSSGYWAMYRVNIIVKNNTMPYFFAFLGSKKIKNNPYYIPFGCVLLIHLSWV